MEVDSSCAEVHDLLVKIPVSFRHVLRSASCEADIVAKQGVLSVSMILGNMVPLSFIDIGVIAGGRMIWWSCDQRVGLVTF